MHSVSVAVILRASASLLEAQKDLPVKDQLKEPIMDLKNAMCLAGKTAQQINQARRDQIKPALPKDFTALTTDVEETSEFLFGSSVFERLEKLKNKLMIPLISMMSQIKLLRLLKI